MINVKDGYGGASGAAGDGVQDDRAAIQSAINRANDPSLNGNVHDPIVYFPPGNYKIQIEVISNEETDPLLYKGLVLKSNIRLQGSGVGVTRLFLSPTPELSTQPLLYGGDATIFNVQIADMTLDGSVTNSPITINEQGQPVNPIEHSHGITLGDKASTNIVLKRLVVRNCSGDGIAIGSESGFMSSNILVEDCRIERCWRQGISCVEEFRNVRIDSCEFVDCLAYGVKAEMHGESAPPAGSNRQLTIQGCTFLPPESLEPSKDSGKAIGLIGAGSGESERLVRDVTIAFNWIAGDLDAGRVEGLNVVGNVFMDRTDNNPGDPDPPLVFRNTRAVTLYWDVERANVVGNAITWEASGGIAVRRPQISATTRAIPPNAHITIAFNALQAAFAENPAEGVGHGIELSYGHHMTVLGNAIVGDSAGADGVFLHPDDAYPEDPVLTDLVVAGTAVRNVGSAFHLLAEGAAATPSQMEPADLERVLVAFGAALKSEQGVFLEAQSSDWAQRFLGLVLTGLVLGSVDSGEDVSVDLKLVPTRSSSHPSTAPTWLTSGMWSRLASGVADTAAVLVGFGEPSDSDQPEHVKNAAAGSLFVQRAEEDNGVPGAGTVLWVREGSAWVAVA